MSSGFDHRVSQEILYRSRLNCEVRLEGCEGRGRHLHHRKLRSQGGPDTVENGLHVCTPCHHAIHTDPDVEPYDRGLLVHSWADPVDIPVTLDRSSPLG